MCIRDSPKIKEESSPAPNNTQNNNIIKTTTTTTTAKPDPSDMSNTSPNILSVDDAHVVRTPSLGTTSNVSGFSASPLSLIHISEPTRLLSISYAVFCLKKKKY
eukprot:TRINITY_DN26904_c0_g1_i1.p1 TRINITY_DN26904_c0_g1~~TRINITY_DN26904_c0_g1_i1.p1  ORF type:complete len:104 (-),score=34.94 TRINITY_DN26904_c0_g1_i1:105-416(-)